MSSLYKRKNSPYYWWTTRYKGRRLRRSTTMTKRHLAKKVQEHWDLCLIKGEIGFLGIGIHPDIAVNQYCQHYIKFIGTRKSDGTVSISIGVLKQFMFYLNSVGIVRLDEIKVLTMNGYIDWLTCAPRTKKNHINIIALMFDQANKEEIMIGNPARNATLPEIKKVTKHRLLNQAEIDIIFNNSGKWKLYYLWLQQTGLRAGDVAMLTYGNINRERRMITNHIRKSRRIHEFPISDVLLAETPNGDKNKPLFPTLYYVIKTDSGELIPNEKRLHYAISKPRKHMQSILSSYNFPSATLHSFRVTFNNTLRDLGLSIQDRQILLAHSSSETTKIYTHPNVELARTFVNKIPNPVKN